MDRRRFLRLFGTSTVVLAAGTGISGYFLTEQGYSYPDEAWKDVEFRYPDPRMRALAYAILAPNPHNRQPWLAELDGENGIRLYCELDRRLPETDPFDRQILIGLGCFGELLRMAAAESGFNVESSWFPEGIPKSDRLDKKPVAYFSFKPGGEPDPLFGQVLNRRSTKEPFDMTKPLSGGLLRELEMDDSTSKTTVEDRLVSELRILTFDAFMIEIQTPRTYKESVDLMRIGNKEVLEQPDGIDMGGGFFSMMKNLGFVTRDKIEDPESMAYKEGIPHFRDIMLTSMAFSWITTPGNTRLDQVKAGISYLRSNLKAAELGLSMHPISQALQEYSEMSTLYKKLHNLLGVKAPERIQMLSRLGYGPKVPQSPRWPLEKRLISR